MAFMKKSTVNVVSCGRSIQYSSKTFQFIFLDRSKFPLKRAV